MAEKRIKLGLDNDELEAKVARINELLRNNSTLSLQGQQNYNTLLQGTNALLEEEKNRLNEIVDIQSNLGVNTNIQAPNNYSAELNPFQNNNQQLPGIQSSSDELISLLSDLEELLNRNSSDSTLNREATPEVGTENNLQNQIQLIITGINSINGTLSSIDLSSTKNTLNRISDHLDGLTDTIQNIDISNVRDYIEAIPTDDILKTLNSINTTVEDISSIISQSERMGNRNNQPPVDQGNGGNGNDNSNNNAQNQSSDGGGNQIGRYANAAASVAVSRNEAYMLAALASMIPVVGAGIGAVFNRLLQAGEQLSTNRARYYATTGSNTGFGGMNEIGLSQAETFQAQIDYRRAYDKDNRGDLYAERAFNIDRGTLTSLARSLRNENMVYPVTNFGNSSTYSRGGVSTEVNGVPYQEYTAGEATNVLMANLQNIVGTENSRAYINEYLQTLVQLNRDQLNATGYTNTFLNTQLIATIADVGQAFQNPEILSKVVTSLQAGLKQAATPQVEALQFSTLAQINPNASLWDLEKMRQNPFAPENAKYLPEFLKSIVNISGGGEEAYFNVASVFPSLKSSPELVEQLVEAVKSGNFGNIDVALKGAYNLQGEGTRSTGVMQQLTAKQEDIFAGYGEGLINAFSNVTTEIGKAIERMESWFGSGSSGNSDSMTQTWKNIDKNTEDIAKNLKEKQGYGPYRSGISKNPVIKK